MLRTRFTDLYGLEAPIALAGMGFISTPPLAAAVANAGGFGMLGIGPEPPEAIAPMVAATRELTDRPFGVNLIVESTRFGPLATEAHVEACIAEQLPVVSFFWHLPPDDWIARLRSAGCHVWFQTSSVTLAREAVAKGIDLIIVQGSAAGGHNRSETGLFTLLPAMADAVGREVPLLAAGGIADGRGLAAALCLGADGAWMGTRFLATRQANAHPEYKRRVVQSCVGDVARTAIFGPEWPDAPMRVLRNRAVDEWSHRDQVTPPQPDPPVTIGHTMLGPNSYAMPKYSAILPTPATEGDFEEMCLAAGESAALIQDIGDAGEVVRRVAAEAERLLPERQPREAVLTEDPPLWPRFTP